MSSTHKSPIRNHHQRRSYRHHHGSNSAPPIPSISIVSSSLNATSSGSTGTVNPTKKKFGKNLNKLIKQQQQQQPSAPPPIQGSSRGGGVASSGLLLLSTKGTKKSVTGSTSTHEALVSVLNGGEGGGKVNTKVSSGANSSSDRDGARLSGGYSHSATGKKDAVGIVWGKAPASASITASAPTSSLTTFSRNKSQPQNTSTHEAKIKGTWEGEKKSQQKLDFNGYLSKNNQNAEKKHHAISKDPQNSSDVTSTRKGINQQQPETIKVNSPSIPSVIPVPVEIPITKPSTPISATQPLKNGEDQVEFMKKLAKERAEKRRKEEEARIQEQKERAAARLKELELKMNLGKKNSKGIDTNHSGSVSATNVAKKKLYDPSRSYSSLLGGGNGVISESVDKVNTSSPKMSSSASPKIQFSSYEDRDRGGRGSNAGPRMLFDPKSGSMVAAPSRDVGSTSSRGRKEKKKSRSSKDRDNDDLHDDGDARPSRYRNKREGGFRKNKHRDNNEDKVSNEASTTKSRKSNMRRGRALPRTCGVLYKRDSTGHIVSADGCEGDQGYGAHSVPGGRIRNPKAFAAFKQRARLEEKLHRSTTDAIYGNHAYTGLHAHQQYEYAGFSLSNGDYDYSNEWQNNGLNRSHFMRKSQQPKFDNHQDLTENQDVELPLSMRVKGDEKLDLLTGLEDSPKLQATAAVWAPSEAVLALAAANGKKDGSEVVDSESDSNLEISESGVYAQSAMALVDNEPTVDGIEASPSIGLGLGFDPAKDMDTMMMSPTIDFENSEKESNLPGLSLDHVEESSIPLSTKNPFVTSSGLLGSSTWGAGNSNSMGSLSNWDYLGGGGANGNANNVNRQNEESSSSFLSLGNALGNQTTWGNSSGFTGGFSGINSPSMGNSD